MSATSTATSSRCLMLESSPSRATPNATRFGVPPRFWPLSTHSPLEPAGARLLRDQAGTTQTAPTRMRAKVDEIARATAHMRRGLLRSRPRPQPARRHRPMILTATRPIARDEEWSGLDFCGRFLRSTSYGVHAAWVRLSIQRRVHQLARPRRRTFLWRASRCGHGIHRGFGGRA